MTSILKADTIQDAAGNNIINESGDTITIGASGDTISIPSGATIANSGTATGFGENNAPYFFAKINTSQSIANTTETVLQFNNEILDSGSAYDTSTYKFTPQTAGKYVIFCQWSVNTSTDCYAFTAIAKNGTNFARFNGRNFDTDSYFVQGIVDLNGSSDYITASGYHEQGGSISNPSNANVCYFGGYFLSA
jgi:hypothetical protein